MQNRIKCFGLMVQLFFVLMATNAYAGAATEAGQKGIDWMTPATLDWQNNHGCFGCHIQGETIWGLSIGKNKGYTIDTPKLQQMVDLLKTLQCADGAWYWEPCHDWRNESTMYAASGLAFYDRLVATDAQANLLNAADFLLTVQQADGHWDANTNGNGSPIMKGPLYWANAMGIITMKRVADLTGSVDYTNSLNLVINWLKGQSSSNTQDNAFILIGLHEGGLPDSEPEIVNTKNTLLSLQNANGGWGSSLGQSSNSYNTGQAVYALRLVGMELTETSIIDGINWLIDNQNADGSWPIGSAGTSTGIAATMWPVIALGEIGILGVEVSVSPEEQEILAHHPDTQMVIYEVTVENTGSEGTNTYNLSVSGAMLDWEASLSQTEVTLDAGESEIVTLTIVAPPELPDGLPVIHTITATSQTNPAVTDSASVTTYTPPPPPESGHETSTTIISGDEVTITKCQQVELAAQVEDLVTGAPVVGPDKGAVNFFVAGIAVGSDSDGDGVFEVTWIPGDDWVKFDTQSLLAVYSGIDLPGTDEDLLSSFATGLITIEDEEGCEGECEATIDIDPDTLNLKSKGQWITCYIELPEGCDVADIDVGSILLNGSISAESSPTEIGDYDGDGIPDLMVKFDRAAVIELLEPADSVTLTVSGELTDGTGFEGNDSIRVIH